MSGGDLKGPYRVEGFGAVSWARQKLDLLSRKQKRLVLAGADFFLFAFSLYLALLLRLGSVPANYLIDMLPACVFAGAIGVLANWLFGFYRILMRAFDIRSVNILASSAVVTGLALVGLAYFRDGVFLPRSAPVIFVIIAFLLIATSRILARWLHQYSVGLRANKTPVLIYGAGEAGNRVAAILSGSPEFSLVGFIDDDKTLWGSYMRGRPVYSPAQINRIVERYGNIRIMLSILDLSPGKKREIYQSLRNPQVSIDVIPSLVDVVAGRSSLSEMRNIRIEDLLGREVVPPVRELFAEPLKGATILVTGGGGSIGSELCRQIAQHGVRHLVIVEQSELALYQIEQDLERLMADSPEPPQVSYHLGDVSDALSMRRILDATRPSAVYHAAAYKHVPIVERNVIEGVRNNIVGTHVMAVESAAAGVSRFTLVSTDKAVRPTNVMGATKRAAELVIQALAAEQGGKPGTIFSMVRFGNVLGSSGSVIPVFKSQIERGGPVTVTHRDVTRYFMTIPEAAQLVVQASYLAKGGEVFVLDMGEPVKIDDLARLTIQLSGLTVRDEQNPDGDIAIEYVGLRPGEKLFEELLIDRGANGTSHPKIMMAREQYLSLADIETHLEAFRSHVRNGDMAQAIGLLQEIVSGFTYRG